MNKRNESLNTLISLLNTKEAVIGVIGLGYVGLPLALSYAESGFRVIGFDINEFIVDLINTGKSDFNHIPSERISKAIAELKLQATTDYSKASSCEALIICVPTPLNNYNEPDLKYIRESINSLIPFIRKGQLISLESTTYPGTTEEEIVPKVHNLGLVPGEDVFVVYSPEREDPGNPHYSTSNIPKIVSGLTSNCKEAAISLYESAIDSVVPTDSIRVAEMSKLLENIHRAVNISLVNEMKIIADAMDINIMEVIKAASTKPFGFVPYYPGPGLGGHCIPIDPFYLSWKAKQYGVSSKFIELTGEVNTYMPKYVVSKTILVLNNFGKAVNGSKILLIGLAYKANVSDTRESPAFSIINELIDLQADVTCYDPLLSTLPSSIKWRSHKPDFFSSVTAKLIARFDACILCTDHSCIDYDLLLESANMIVDCRRSLPKRANVVYA